MIIYRPGRALRTDATDPTGDITGLARLVKEAIAATQR
jgi:hypothetical protein